ncbi:MAG: PEGA domain-containing protein [Candidatus Portnoybacteria bacterium]|nr:PEGA domain-containing protein [Candidatus Portnoybacteria bacterium]
MTKIQRRIAFYIFLALFIILVPTIILYALGYSLNTKDMTIKPTGGIYLESEPKAQIYLNEKPRGKTPRFIKRLSPKIYNIRLTKKDYHQWEKQMTVEEGIVSKAENIILLPLNPKIQLTIKDKIQAYTLINDDIIYATSQSINYLDISRNQEEEMAKTKETINSIATSQNQEYFLIQTPTTHLLLNRKTQTTTDLNQIIKKKSKYSITEISNPKFNNNGDKIYFLSKNNLYSITTENLTLSEPLKQNILNYTKYKDGIIYLEYFTGKIYELDLTSLESSEISNQVFPSLTTGEWKISENNKKLLCQKQNSIEIVYLEETTEDSMIKKKGEIQTIQIKEKINEAEWYTETNKHILISTPTAILFTELDLRPPRNTINYITTENPKIEYNQDKNILYFLSQERLYQTKI